MRRKQKIKIIWRANANTYVLRWLDPGTGRVVERHCKTTNYDTAKDLADRIRDDLRTKPKILSILEVRPTLNDRGRSLRSGIGLIYALEAVGLRMVKIGWASDPRGRLCKLMNLLPVDSQPIGLRMGTRADEAFIHRQLTAYHAKHEWFYMTAEVCEYITANFRLTTGDGWRNDTKELLAVTSAGAILCQMSPTDECSPKVIS